MVDEVVINRDRILKKVDEIFIQEETGPGNFTWKPHYKDYNDECEIMPGFIWVSKKPNFVVRFFQRVLLGWKWK